MWSCALAAVRRFAVALPVGIVCQPILPELLVTAPTIVAPVSRHLSRRRPRPSVAFYRDTLGFEVHAHAGHSAELTLGPARITLGLRDPLPAATGGASCSSRPTMSRRRYDILAARGAEPTAPEDVNWIKMRMIEVRDPDGNTLWFGANRIRWTEQVAAQRMLRKVMPELPLSRCRRRRRALPRRVRLRGQLSAARHRRHGPRRTCALLLIARTAQHSGIGSCGFYVTDADALHAELLPRGANVQGGP